DDVDRPEATGIHWYVASDQHAQHEQDGGARNRLRRVEIAVLLFARAGKVDAKPSFLSIDRQAYDNSRAKIHRQFELAVLQRVDKLTHSLFGVVLHVAHIGEHNVRAELRDHLFDFSTAALIGGNLRLHVCDLLVDVA